MNTAAAVDINLLELERIKRLDRTPRESDILGAFSYGMYPDAPAAAAEAARKLDQLCPPLEEEDEAGDFIWTIWEVLVEIARSSDVTSEIHICLVHILEELLQLYKGVLKVGMGEQRVWDSLPFFPDCLAAGLSDPTIELVDFNQNSAIVWQNISSFGARCFGADLAGVHVPAMDALRLGLEEDLSVLGNMALTECRIQVAHKWVFHASKPLLRWAQENIGRVNVTEEDQQSYFESGSLYKGTKTMCLQRWSFWMSRFEELSEEGSGMSEDVRNLAREAEQTMNSAERRVGNTLADWKPPA